MERSGVNLSAYGYLRLAAASPAVRVADVDFNLTAIIETYRILRAEGVQIAVFPELATVGYTCGDLLLHTPLLDASEHALTELAGLVCIEGGLLVVGAPIRAWGRLYNCAVAIGSEGIVAVIPKQFIPNYAEYYEQRWFSRPTSGDFFPTIELDGRAVPFGIDILIEVRVNERSATIGVELCEDLWAVEPPSGQLASAGADVLLNLSASNELLAKAEYRRDLVRMQSARCIAAYVYASSGAGESTTDTVFSGHCLIAENGIILAEDRAFSFQSRWVIADVDLDRLAFDRRRIATFGQHRFTVYRRFPAVLPQLSDSRPRQAIEALPFVPSDPAQKHARCKEIVTIQRTGLAKRLMHTGVQSVVIGVSGGLDSALALLVCVETFDLLGYDRKNIRAVILPGPGSSERTQSQAAQLATALGVSVLVIPITPAVEQHLRDIGHGGEHDTTYENAQARERTQILMDMANRFGALMVGTSDLSELALGWTTYGGDHMSMYGVNAGVPKTLVRSIVEWWSEYAADDAARAALQAIMATPISPELLPPDSTGTIRQRTEDVLGPYVVHDFFLYHFIRWGYSPAKILVLAEWAFTGRYGQQELRNWFQVFIEKFFSSQFKRSCLPDGPKIGSIVLSPRADWRMPSDAAATAWHI